MSGIIPESLGELSSLVSLDIYGNTWEGAIIEAHFTKLGGMRKVSIGNYLPNISLVFNIEVTTVVLCNARISGTIPDWFLQLDLQLDYLDVGLIIWPAGSWGPAHPIEKKPDRPVMGFEMARPALGWARLWLGCLKPHPARLSPRKPRLAI
ncbi:unnamed protein product [Prunus armeniaca]